jgi:transposase
MLYTEEFKRSAVQKFLARGNRTTRQIIKDLGISYSTIYLWRDQFANLEGMKKSSRPAERPANEKLKLLLEYEALEVEKRGEYLRRNGLYEANLIEWRAQLDAAFSPDKKTFTRNPELALEQKIIKDLEQELRRKDKALAEVTALLVLKKKAGLIWGSDEEE